jgi:hypothetical protein
MQVVVHFACVVVVLPVLFYEASVADDPFARFADKWREGASLQLISGFVGGSWGPIFLLFDFVGSQELHYLLADFVESRFEC